MANDGCVKLNEATNLRSCPPSRYLLKKKMPDRRLRSDTQTYDLLKFAIAARSDAPNFPLQHNTPL